MSEPNTNSDAALNFIREGVLEALEKAKGAGLDTLIAFRDIGRGLAEAKEVIGSSPKGAFGAWCEENFPFSKEWRARLMKLAAEWQNVERAMAWATGKMGRVLGRKEYSVDGALALVAEWIKADPEGAEAAGLGDRVKAEEEKAEKARERAREKAGEKAQEETEAEALRRMLAEAMETIQRLEAELAKARGEKPKGAKAKPDGAGDQQQQQQQGPKVDKPTAARARKVAEMALRPGAYGEALSAWERLNAMAGKAGMGIGPFCAACGIDYAAIEAAVAKAKAEKAEADKVAA